MSRRGRWRRTVVLLFGMLAVGLVARTVLADTGPKPSVEFEFEYDVPQVAILDGHLLICENADCTRRHPLEEIGPQQFTCSATRCWSEAYGYGERLKLIVEFEDRTRESDVFRKKAFNARYLVRVRAASLMVMEEEEVLNSDFTPALSVTLITETLAATAITLTLRPRKIYVFLIPLASLVSLPVAWVVFPAIGLYDFLTVILAEVFVVLFEGAALYVLTRRTLTIELAMAYSLVINVVSFAIGLFVI